MGRIAVADTSTMFTIDNFKGLNISDINDTQLQLGESGNMYNFYINKDRKLKKIEGYKRLFEPIADTPIRGMWYGKIGSKYYFLFATNGHIYYRDLSAVEPTNVDLGSIDDNAVNFLGFNGIVYILNGSEYYKWNGESEQIEVVEGYIPQVYCAALPNGERTQLESINALTGKKHMTFNADGTSTVYQLAETDLINVDKVMVDAEEITTGFEIDLSKGTVTFTTAPKEGVDNVDIYWTKSNESRSQVTSNTNMIYFGQANDVRVFMFGNSEYPNRFIYSDLADGQMSAEYFPVTNFSDVGTANIKITDIAKQQDIFVVFKESETYYGTIGTLTIGDMELTTFPIYPLNDSVGNVAVGQTRLLNNSIISIDKSIHRWLSTSVQDERNEENISQRIQIDLNKYDLTKSITVDWNEKYQYWLSIGNIVWIYNYYNDTYSRLKLTDNITNMIVINGELYCGTENGKIIKFDEDETKFDGEIISAICELNFYDFEKEYLRKALHKLYILMKPEMHSQLDISYTTDKGAGDKKVQIKYNKFTFKEFSFKNLSFCTYSNPKPFKIKLKAKKFTFLKLILKNEQPNDRVSLLSLVMKSEYGGETK